MLTVGRGGGGWWGEHEREGCRVIIWRWVGGNEFWAGVEEEFFEGGERPFTVIKNRSAT